MQLMVQYRKDKDIDFAINARDSYVELGGNL